MKSIIVGKLSKENERIIREYLDNDENIDVFEARGISIFQLIRYDRIIFVFDLCDKEEKKALWLLGHSLPYSFGKNVDIFTSGWGKFILRWRWNRLLKRKGCLVSKNLK